MEISERAKRHYKRHRNKLPDIEWTQRVIDLYDALPDDAKQGVRLQDWLLGTFGPKETTRLNVAEKNFDLLEEGQFRGIGSAFNIKFESGFVQTIIKPGAFSKTIVEDRDRIKLLWQHNDAEPIGKPLSMEEVEVGLEIVGQLSDVPKAHDALELMRDDVINELSIGWRPRGFSFEEIDNELVRIVTDLQLFEISLVSFGANPGAKITDVNAEDGATEAASTATPTLYVHCPDLDPAPFLEVCTSETVGNTTKFTPMSTIVWTPDVTTIDGVTYPITETAPWTIDPNPFNPNAAPLVFNMIPKTEEDEDPSLTVLMDRISDAVRRLDDADVPLDEETLLRLELAHRRIVAVLDREADTTNAEEEHETSPRDVLELEEAELVLRRNT